MHIKDQKNAEGPDWFRHAIRLLHELTYEVEALKADRIVLLAMLNQQARQENQDRDRRYRSPYSDEFYNES